MPRGRPKKSAVALTQDDILALKSLVGLAKQLQQQAEATETEEVEEHPVTTNRKRKSKKQVTENEGVGPGNSRRLKEREKGAPNYARREPMKIPKKRINLFDKDEDFNSFKEDTKIDKLLWKGKKTHRRKTRQTLVEAECVKCNYVFDVSPNEIKKDFKGKPTYVCNECEKLREPSDYNESEEYDNEDSDDQS